MCPWPMLLGLKGGVEDTGTGQPECGERLHLVEVLALLLLETVLAVEDELEGVEGTDSLLGEDRITTLGADGKEGSTGRGRRHEGVASDGGALDSSTMSAAVEVVVKFQREFLVWALEKHHTSPRGGCRRGEPAWYQRR